MKTTVAWVLLLAGVSGAYGGKEGGLSQQQGEVAIQRDWARLAEANPRLEPPKEWDGKSPSRELVQQWMEREKERLLKLADQARAFVETYADSPMVTQAMQLEFEALDSLDRLMPEAVRERVETVAQTLLKRGDLETSDRFTIEAGRLLRTAKTSEELEAGARSLLKRYPDGQAYEILLSAARSGSMERGRAIAEEIVNSTTAPASVREQAESLLRRFNRVGKPLEMKFQATNGRQIDLQKMRGKVVVIDFWATWCGPCVAQLPELKEFYERYKDRGVELLGISFDSDLFAFETFLREKAVSWPQHLDSGGWHSRFAEEYGIHSVPTVWLVDKKGILRDLNGGEDLEKKVMSLLVE